MKISEIFYSIQGEGKNAGMPAVFLRLANCNLRCVWCDTAYSWNWEKFDPKKETVSLSAEAVVSEIRRYPCKQLVITGGEPLLQQKELVQVTRSLKNDRFWIEVETNATLVPTAALDKTIDQYNCSPKLNNSGHPAGERENEKALRFFARSPKAIFKFVIATTACSKEAETLMKRYAISPLKVYLMPEGRTSEAVRQKMRWLAPLCLERGYHLTDRLHIHLFGDRRGA